MTYIPGGGSGAPTTATYITQVPEAGLSAEQALSTLATGVLKVTTGTGVVSIGAKADIGLGNVDNTSDAGKPVSTAQQTALDLKADLASPTFTGTVAGITKTMVGLANVDNTSDANKPVSTATQTALNLKQNIAGAPRTLHTAFSGANVGTAETDMSSYSMPGGTLSADGQVLQIIVWGTTAANANTKTGKVYFNGTEFARPIASAGNAFGWFSIGYIIRTAATTVNAFSRVGQGTAVIGTNESANDVAAIGITATLSGAVIIKVTGQSGTASNDILLKGFLVALWN